MNKILSLAALAAGLTLSVAASAQEQATTASSNGSYRPIPNSDIMFSKTIWRAVDLREKQNKPMFAEGKEISRIILDAVKRGELQAYANDSLTRTLTPAQVQANASYVEETQGLTDAEKAAGFTDADLGGGSDDGWGSSSGGGDGWGAPAKKSTAKGKKGATTKKVAAAPPKPAAPPSYEYRPKDLYQMELKEDMIFDKKRSRMYHDIKSLTLVVPSTLPSNASGIEKPIGTFKYSDLVRVFRNNPTSAIWFNPQNDAQHKNLADAFELWLFNSYIVRVSNPNNARLDEIYGGQQQGILASQQAAADLIEYEYNLWSF
ncbi:MULTISPECIES: gliding motility protein GldN [Hymenobacter]|uniref:Gliding motility protein GldN n=2 Tax=Hymenobacter TaxID=89966 RepID=A0ABS6WWE0_9BACT|nr:MULTISPECIES: gliding motility protein GldN [Hymenobacter]MBW3127912.1 gliding motility protein GldN [Hymenobacter profundi]QNE41551.1 gliding motility protein GldN [Hymenobacter sp. NBH84]